MSRDALPAPVHAAKDAVLAAARAVQAQDRGSMEAAAAQMAAAGTELLRVLLGGAVRTALERVHPQGLDGEDARDLLERCVRSALAWLPDVEVPALIVVLTGALGMQDPDDEPMLAPDVIAVHAVLLMAELGAGPDAIQRDLDGAIAELARAQTVEMP